MKRYSLYIKKLFETSKLRFTNVVDVHYTAQIICILFQKSVTAIKFMLEKLYTLTLKLTEIIKFGTFPCRAKTWRRFTVSSLPTTSFKSIGRYFSTLNRKK